VDSDLVIVGRVARPHGVHGEIRIEYANPNLHFFSHYQEIFVQVEREKPIRYRVLQSRVHKNRVLCKIEGVVTRDQAESLRDAQVLIHADSLPPTAEHEYYWRDVIGMSVYTETGRYVGEVSEILSTAGHDVYVIHGRGREYLVPAVEGWVQELRGQSYTMIVRTPDAFNENDDL
jgi:16S rRNA processing protein RimM